MSHIDEAFKRIGRIAPVIDGRHPVAAGEARAPAMLERYALEKASRLNENKVATLTGGPHPVSDPQLLDNTPSAPPAPGPALGSKVEEPKVDIEADKLVDFHLIADYVGFVAGAVGRHKIIAVVTFILVLTATAAAVRFWPKTYHIEAKLLAQRYDRMAALGNPGRALAADADVPSRTAAEAILRRDSLIALIGQTDLLNQWELTRAPILKVKDTVFRRVFGEPAVDERLDSLVGLLEQRLLVTVSAEGLIDINLDWPDARLGYQLVEMAVRNFVETRKSSETSAITESISILGGSADALQAEIDRSFAELQSTQAIRPRSAAAKRALAAPSALAAPATVITATAPVLAPPILSGASPELLSELTRQKTALDSAGREIARLQDLRRQQLSELQARLASALAIYTEGHPIISGLRQSIASLSVDSPQLGALKNEAQRLEAQVESTAKRVEEEEQKPLLASRAVAGPQLIQAREKPASTRAEETVAPAPGLGSSYTEALGPLDSSSPSSLRLRLELGQLADIRDRINGAQIELATSRAAFKYRYSVTRPAQKPRKPIKPNVAAILIAGALGALVLAVAASACTDLLSGRIVEPWQVERQVRVPVLIRLRQL